MKVKLVCAAFALLGANLPAAASGPSADADGRTPSDIVLPFYRHIGHEGDPAFRNLFTDPARAVLDAADALRASGEGECLDPNPSIDSTDFDQAEIDSSLKSIEAVEGDTARVVTAFTVGGEARRMQWQLSRIGGRWKISDILSVSGDWALSQYHCE